MSGSDKRLGPLSPFLRGSVALHAAAATTLLAFPAARSHALAAMVANQVLITGAALLPRCSWLGTNVTRLPERVAARGVVALTFDDGPDPEVTPGVLDMLRRAGARATFFCVGRRVEAHPDLARAIRAGGHGIENHTFDHPNGFALRGLGGMDREIRLAQQAIADTVCVEPTFFRPPAGIHNPFLAAALSRNGLALVSWTRRGFDTVSTDPDRVAARLLKRLRAGDILLLHDGNSARDTAGQPVVLPALERVLREMARRGFRSQSLGELLGAAEPADS